MRAIDADKLIPIFEEMIRSGDYCKDCIKDAISEVEQAPTLSSDDVRGVGEWIAHGDCGVTECSVCGWNIEEYVEYNYCPSCGAKMEVTADA